MSTTAPLPGPAVDGSLARAVHDLRGPLTVIRGLCDMLERGEPSADRRRRLRAIDTEAVRIADALEGLLVPVEAPAARAPVDLAALAARAVERHRWAAGARPARLILSASDRPVIAADPRAVTRALDNLIGNALRHCRTGGRVTVRVGARGPWAHLCVSDDGPGVPEQDREAIFRPGCRGSAPRGHGQGLGLAIARDIAEAHGGRLHLDRSAVGATFRLILPCAGTAAEGEEAAS